MRRMRRSMQSFEQIIGVLAPPRLHACAYTEPYWLNICDAGTVRAALGRLSALSVFL